MTIVVAYVSRPEGQAALGMAPQPLQLPFQEAGVPDVPPLWTTPGQNTSVPRSGVPASILAPQR